MGFRINSFSVEGESLKTPSVSLFKNSKNTTGNYFTVIIGNNGTGKSRFVSSLVEAFRDIGEGKRRARIYYNLNYLVGDKNHIVERKIGQKVLDRKLNKSLWPEDNIEIPSKVIAITTSISDKFSVDDYNRRRQLERSSPKKRDYYTYLGPKFMSGASNRALMDRAVTTFLSHVGDYGHNESFRHIFDYLNYEPVMKLAYEVRKPRIIQNESQDLTGASFKEHIVEYALRRGGFRESSIYKLIEEQDDSYWSQMAETYNLILAHSDIPKKRLEFSFLVNFSEENEIREKGKLGSQQARLYSLLEDLRRFELVRGPQIRLYKKGGGEFDFSDASSGEASILSTLIALVPNLEDNSLVVIDEPEISLHPSWQYRYIELIDRIISLRKGCHVVIATHSHFLVSDLPLERSSVVHFKEGKHSSIAVDYINGETQGLSAEDVLLNVFDLPSTRNYYLSKNISEALELVAEGKLSSDRFSHLLSILKKHLPNLKKVDPLKDVIVTLIDLKGS
ncbi:AAA domain-containing protein, putative AbiEii toxin, Type IV TA system [Marinobacter persicus]|uniref:AAA domain-containing protein, putative AbiEii toxin, Type IV TA system n=1 Tax=Marinobacter persicus TaxID=930118 RepID=A0A1I3U0Q7_9GAMM|nr:AAA family ATPase [Marinobacter persicus]GHD45464.1 hypothetical protein GCM10008110_11240 [Marinobacter persicus]SFJ76303.1 AAA domain-containing protein, putative AbiEii toxin, Type IV TA system [Marinobacter persicus]